MKVYRWYGVILLCLLCLAGCSHKEVITEEKETEILTVDWKANGFAVSEEVQEKQSLWALEHIKWQHADVCNDASAKHRNVWEAGVYGGRIYRIYQIFDSDQSEDKEGKNKFLLETYDTATMRSEVTEIDSEKLGIADGFISGMGLIGQGEFVFRILEYGQDQADQSNKLKLFSNYLLYTDLEKNTEKTDVLPVYLEKEITDKVYNYDCFCDADGNSYVRAGFADYPFQDLYILDREGNLLMEHQGEQFDQILEPLRMFQGDLIFPIYNVREKFTRLVWFDTEKSEEQVIAGFEKESMIKVYGIQGNDIYYESYNGIVKWNIASGDRCLIFQFSENGISRTYNTMLVLQEGKLPILRMYGTIDDEEEDWLVAMSDQEVERSDKTRIASLNGTSSKVQNNVAVASRRNPDFYFTYEANAEEDENDFRNRIIAEMVAGGGPDILYVSLEDMELLQNMGLLKDIKTLLSEETLDRILPGVIELGTVDGTFVGLAPETNVYTMITLKSIWDQDTWSLEDILALMDTGNFTGMFCQGTTSFAPRALLNQMTILGLQNSALIDWETGESHFESQLFLKILETAKAYGDNPIRTDAYLGAGGCLGMFIGADLETFDELYEQYGADYYFVGEPTNERCGNYLTSDGVLVVNGNVSDPKAAAAYLECMLRDEIQYLGFSSSHLPILKVSLEDIETFEVDDEMRIYWRQHRLKIREDGTTALNDYKELLESCVPYPDRYNTIISLVWEDAQGYILGDKSAKDVAGIIDNRIQLYLDEKDGR